MLECDADLGRAFARGETDALARVYEHYVGGVRALLRGGFWFLSRGEWLRFRGCAEADLEDVVQEVFARAFAPAARLGYDGLRPYSRYLFAIARNLTVERERRRARVQAVPLSEGWSPHAASDADSPRVRQLDAWRAWRRLIGFVQQLGRTERVVFELRFQRHVSIERTASELGVTQYRVKRIEQRLRSGIARLAPPE